MKFHSPEVDLFIQAYSIIIVIIRLTFFFFTLKELRNYKRKFFCMQHKNKRKHNQHFKTAVFHSKFTLCQIKPNICR